jgi:thymidylate synthase (FAD)
VSANTVEMIMQVLDHGYVRYVDHMGSDLSVVNAARVSFEKEATWRDHEWVDLYDTGHSYCMVCGVGDSQWVGERCTRLEDKDIRLLSYLAREGHTSPFRHATVTLECYAPLFVCRQWWKHVIGGDHATGAWNESSRRYVTEEPEFYIPEWRWASESKKQGSAGELDNPKLYSTLDNALKSHIAKGLGDYNWAISEGVAPEQARAFLPAYVMYIRWRWTASLQMILHFLDLRIESHAQWEIRQYANAVQSIVAPLFPNSLEAWGHGSRNV